MKVRLFDRSKPKERGTNCLNVNHACKMAARREAGFLLLLENHQAGRFHLQWEILLKDNKGLTRAYYAQGTDWVVVIDDPGDATYEVE